MTNNLEAMKKAVDKAKEEYRNAVQHKINEIISSGLSCIGAENNSYCVEMKTEGELLTATDAEVEKNDELFERVETIVRAVADDIYSALHTIDEWNEVEFNLYCNNVIHYNIKVDGMEFEYEFTNRYNNK